MCKQQFMLNNVCIVWYSSFTFYKLKKSKTKYIFFHLSVISIILFITTSACFIHMNALHIVFPCMKENQSTFYRCVYFLIDMLPLYLMVDFLYACSVSVNINSKELNLKRESICLQDMAIECTVFSIFCD